MYKEAAICWLTSGVQIKSYPRKKGKVVVALRTVDEKHLELYLNEVLRTQFTENLINQRWFEVGQEW